MRPPSILPCHAISLVLVLVGATGCNGTRSMPPPGDGGMDARAADAAGREGGSEGGPCVTPSAMCDGVCVNLDSDDHNCARCGYSCPAGIACVARSCSCGLPLLGCSGACINPMSDAANCGGCGHACAATEQCAAGSCIPACPPSTSLCFDPVVPSDGGVAVDAGDADASVSDGGMPAVDAGPATGPVCVDLMTDADDCGHCGTHCGPGGVCSGGHCMCAPGATNCSGSCADLMTDPEFCGLCTVSCGAGGTCTAGACTACGPTRRMCVGGCIDVTSDDHNCGDCLHFCPSGETCVDSMCSCGAPRADCGAGCIDLTSDAANCGHCGNNCGPGGACVAGSCTCGPGYTMCGIGCSDVTRDRHNCATCGHACAATEACIASACVTAPLYHGWASPIAGCTTTSYTSTYPTALGGMYPYNTGDSNACRAWKLAATVCTTMPTMYVDTNNWTCPASGGFTDPVFGTYCASVGVQYSCSTCPAACNAMCIYNPLSLRNCSGAETAQM